MRRANKATSAAGTLDLHDDNLLSVEIYPPRTRTSAAEIILRLCDDATKEEKTLLFRGCANMRYIMDFDVLADNWFAQTKGLYYQDDANTVKRFVDRQKSHWNVKYMPPSPNDKPIRKKLSSLPAYRLFRIKFYGGVVEILSRGLKLGAPPHGSGQKTASGGLANKSRISRRRNVG